MIAHANQTGRRETSPTTIEHWRQLKSRRWADTSLHHVLATYTMASMWVQEPSCTMPLSHITGIGARWKRFLSLVSPMATPYGSDPQSTMRCRAKRSSSGRDLGLEKTAIAY